VSYRNCTRAPLPSPNNCVAGLAGVLERYLDFAKGDAALYASIVLKRNGEGSADWVGSAAMKVLGTWMRMSQEGMAAALLTSTTETWRFSDDLMCEHKFETYEGYVSSFGSGYSVPSSNRKAFIWAPSDSRTADTLDIVIVPLSGGEARTLSFVWRDEGLFPRSVLSPERRS
jgi:hypothetical protein